MKILEIIILPIAVAAANLIVFNVVFFFKKREERALSDDDGKSFRTRAPKAVRIFFLIFAVLFFAGGITVSVLTAIDGVKAGAVIAIALTFAAIGSLGIIGYICAVLNYLIVGEEEITVMRAFKKPKKVKLSEIRYYYSFISKMYSGIKVYDGDGRILFSEESMNVNSDRFIRVLDASGVTQLTKFPPAELKTSPVYRSYAKKRSLKIYGWIMLGMCAMFFGLFALVFSLNKERQFINERASGTVSEYRFGSEYLDFKLNGDESTYRINNLYWEKLNSNIEGIAVGSAVDCIVGYVDSNGYLNVTQFTADGVTYLFKADAEQADADNYRTGVILSWVFSGLGCALAAAGAACLIGSAKIKVKND